VIINSEDLVIHVSETTRSELEVAVPLVGVGSDNINGGLLHTSLAETSPGSGSTRLCSLVLKDVTWEVPYFITSSSIRSSRSVTFTDSGDGGSQA
jgi:hypothetical protein